MEAKAIGLLTSEQVRGIYSGKITSWRELGVDLDAKLLPYQRNKGSGSQTALERLMGETPIMEPIREDKLRGMGGIISATADCRGDRLRCSVVRSTPT